jgi:hypothetical protein
MILPFKMGLRSKLMIILFFDNHKSISVNVRSRHFSLE